MGAARTDFVIQQAIGGRGFRLAAWETGAIAQKARDLATRPAADRTPEARHDLVIAYFDALGRIDELSGRIEHIYADPDEAAPAALAAPLQAELNDLRATQEARRPAVEQIIEGQVAAVLEEAGLTTGGHVWPPVRFAFTESPDYLIVSPRDHIAVKKGVYLDPGISVADMERIETQVGRELDVSALVDGTGGFSSYPTMVVAYPDLDWVLDTVAHEWTHTYMYLPTAGLALRRQRRHAHHQRDGRVDRRRRDRPAGAGALLPGADAAGRVAAPPLDAHRLAGEGRRPTPIRIRPLHAQNAVGNGSPVG